jgi:FdhD protein
MIFRYRVGQGLRQVEDTLVREQEVQLWVGDRLQEVLVCTPVHLDELAVGRLFTAGLLGQAADLRGLEVDQGLPAVRVMLAATPAGAEWAGTGGSEGPHLEARDCLRLMEQLLQVSPLHRATGGVHTVALARGGELLLFREDVGRHNAMDKVIGHCLLHGVDTSDKVLVHSGRVSADLAAKAIKAGFRALVARAAVTDLACSLAREAGMTLVGFTRGERFNVYSGETRVRTEGEA